MDTWFVDTFFFLAFLSSSDKAHEAAVQLIEDLEVRLLTTTTVLIEVGDALRSPYQRQRFGNFMEFAVHQPTLDIVHPTRHVFDEALSLYGNRPDKAWSLTDCISFTVMRGRGISTALTGDRHFVQAGFDTRIG